MENQLKVIYGESLGIWSAAHAVSASSAAAPSVTIGGAPKVARLAVLICRSRARANRSGNLPTNQGATLYLCIEDTEAARAEGCWVSRRCPR